MPEYAYAKLSSALRERRISAADDSRVELHEMAGVPGFLAFRCERLHLELSPSACAKSYMTPRSEACVSCAIGARHAREVEPAAAAQKRSATRPSINASPDESDIQDRLNRRAALRATGGQSAALACIRCLKSAATNGRLIGRMRLVRAQTICVSCYNREKEVLRGANAKGARPKMWAGRLRRTQIVCVEGGVQKRIPIGLSTGVDEALRYAARVHPKVRLVGVFVADDFHLLVAPHGEGFDRAKRERRERIAARKNAGAEARRTEQALAEPETTDKHDASATSAPPAAEAPRKLVAGARIGLLELQRDVGRGKWACVCECGRTTVQHATTLRGTRKPSCGCGSSAPTVKNYLPRQPAHMAPKPSRTSAIVTGMQLGRLTALRHVRETKWRWKCVCGSERTLDSATVFSRKIRHCGCGGKKRANVATKTADEQLRAFYAPMPAVLLGPL
ncbi:hypothetical protein [Paraburkholderia sp. BL17N1]|uniref:hypothetical protein n=1 Tax=Paraburkholderia sp. BL17N1 TaxID=1938798 RepID=UPI000F29175D|nr:hypothetical protein [Paraburkholderia sp. BL17N1]RKR44576.1 hypothetical protein B0G82_2188 [Paraburkholderia sp. BL17N1]